MSFSDLISALRRHVMLILSVAALVTGLTIYYLYTLTPIYSSQGLIALGEQGLASQRRFDFEESQSLNSSVIEGELAILRSNEVLARVARRLELDTQAEFNASLREPDNRIDYLGEVINFAKDILLPKAPQIVDVEEELSEGAEPSQIERSASANAVSLGDIGEAVGILRSKVRVRQQGSSFVVAVNSSAENPNTSAAIVNAMMDEYILFLTDKRFKAAQRFTTWLEERVIDLADRLEQSEEEVNAFRSFMETDSNSSALLEQQMRELTTKLVNVRAELAQVNSQSQRFSEISETEGLLAAAPVLSLPITEEYRDDLSSLRRQKASVESAFGPDSSQVAAAVRSMAIIEGAIEEEVRRSLRQMEIRTNVLQANVNSLERSLSDLESLARSRSSEQIRLDQLERIAQANQRVYEEFLARLKESSEIQNLRSTEAEVVSYASPPSSPAFPNKKVSAVLSLVGGLMLGTALALLIEMRNRPLRNARLISRQTNLSVYGQLPDVTGRWPRNYVNNLLISETPSNISSALKDLAKTITMSRGHHDENKTVLISSNFDKGTKSRVAVELAVAVAHSGKRCLLIDADTRSANLTSIINAGLKPPHAQEFTFTDGPRDEAVIQRAIVELSPERLYFLPTKVLESDPATIFKGQSVETKFGWLKEEFDCVIVNGPSLEDVFDIIPLRNTFDTALYVVPSNKSFVQKLNTGTALIEQHSVDELGIILTGKKYVAAKENLRTLYAPKLSSMT